jgi:hypothetical protein
MKKYILSDFQTASLPIVWWFPERGSRIVCHVQETTVSIHLRIGAPIIPTVKHAYTVAICIPGMIDDGPILVDGWTISVMPVMVYNRQISWAICKRMDDTNTMVLDKPLSFHTTRSLFETIHNEYTADDKSYDIWKVEVTWTCICYGLMLVAYARCFIMSVFDLVG